MKSKLSSVMGGPSDTILETFCKEMPEELIARIQAVAAERAAAMSGMATGQIISQAPEGDSDSGGVEDVDTGDADFD
ncbi:hypothetical protein ACFL4P_01770 [Gemmatimonadota bacterium]